MQALFNFFKALPGVLGSLPGLVSIGVALVDAWKKYKEAKHKRAIEKIKGAQTKKELEDAINDLSDSP
jgi:hypothetical protein